MNNRFLPMSVTVSEYDCNKKNAYKAPSQPSICVERYILPGEGNKVSAGASGCCGSRYREVCPAEENRMDHRFTSIWWVTEKEMKWKW